LKIGASYKLGVGPWLGMGGPTLANWRPLIVNMNSEFAIFIMRGKENFSVFSAGAIRGSILCESASESPKSDLQ